MKSRIKCLRKLRGLSQDSFAKIFHVSQNAVSNWEQEKNKIDIGIATEIAKYFSVPIEFVYGCEFSISRPVSHWYPDELEDMENAPEDCKEYFLCRYGNANFHDNVESTQKRTLLEEPNAEILSNQRVYYIPLYESVSAGFGAQANDEVIERVPCFFNNITEASETLCVKVNGDSMYPKIEDGDIIQVHKQDSVDSCSVAVVLIDGEDAVVKKVVYGADWIELHSFNPMYKTMRFSGSEVERVSIVGLVKKVTKEI